jgi:segregation and condensation protein A
MTFRGLIADVQDTLVVVARFLSLLELYREGSVRFEQVVALGELQITWIGAVEGEIAVSDEFDREPVMEAPNGTEGVDIEGSNSESTGEGND